MSTSTAIDVLDGPELQEPLLTGEVEIPDYEKRPVVWLFAWVMNRVRPEVFPDPVQGLPEFEHIYLSLMNAKSVLGYGMHGLQLAPIKGRRGDHRKFWHIAVFVEDGSGSRVFRDYIDVRQARPERFGEPRRGFINLDKARAVLDRAAAKHREVTMKVMDAEDQEKEILGRVQEAHTMLGLFDCRITADYQRLYEKVKGAPDDQSTILYSGRYDVYLGALDRDEVMAVAKALQGLRSGENRE